MAVPIPSAAQVAQLRRMVAEPTSATYDDPTLIAYIEARPLLDTLGRERYQVSTTSPPGLESNPDWGASGGRWDVNAAAADIWAEKAAALAGKFDFTTDGQTFARSQLYEQAMKQVRYYRARQSARSITLWPKPAPNPDYSIATEME